MAVDAAEGGAGDLGFIEFLFDSSIIAGGEFHASEHTPTEGEMLLLVAEGLEMADQGEIAETRFGAVIDGETLRPLEGTRDERHVQLQAEPFIQIVAGEDLGDGAVQVLAGWIAHFLAVHLDSAKVSELLRHSCERAFADFASRLVGGVNSA